MQNVTVCLFVSSNEFLFIVAVPTKYQTNWGSREITPDFNPSDELHYVHSFGKLHTRLFNCQRTV